MKRHNKVEVLSILSGLLCDSNYQSNTLRIETLINLAAAHCNGTKTPQRKSIDCWFKKYLDTTQICLMEDPLEDVFASRISSKEGNFRILEGMSESGVFWLQCVIDMLDNTPKSEPFLTVNKSIYAFLRLSELMSQKANVRCNTLGKENAKESIDLPKQSDFSRYADYTTFSCKELEAQNIDLECLVHFILDQDDLESIEDCDVNESLINRRPLLKNGDSIILIAPAAISVTLRYFALEFFNHLGSLEVFEKYLHEEEIQILFNSVTSDLDIDPVKFIPQKRPEKLSLKTSHYTGKYDEGKYCVIVFIIRDLKSCRETSLTDMERFDNETIEIFNDYIQNLCNEISDFSDFDNGYIFVVSGGIGRGMFFDINQVPEKWKCSFLSLPDLVTLSKSRNVNMKKLRQLSQQESLCEKLGISILNPNGF